MVARWNEDAHLREVTLTFGQEGYLLFKLSGQDLKQGRLVKSASLGPYLVVAPSTWERDETVAGPPLAAPEPVALDGYIAHFFDLEKGNGTKIAFHTSDGELISISSGSTHFELIGERLEDVSGRVGPLFSEPPRIRVPNAHVWEKVRTIVIGEEGGGRGRWRTEFSPDPDSLEQSLPSEVLDRKGGWYFLRFYDANDDLIESLDFRFLTGLRQMRVLQSCPFPSNDGHDPTRVEIAHDPGVTFQEVQGLPDIQIEYCGDRETTVTIPPNPDYDITRWQVGYENGPQVEVTILVERIWWGLGEEVNEPPQWEDKRLVLSRDDFTAVSKAVLWLRLPRHRWVDKVLVGFERARAKSYPIKVREKALAVPLREFGDAQELQQFGIVPFNVWILRRGEAYKGILCELIINLTCEKCGFVASNEEDLFRHIESFHLDEFFRSLTYQELCALYPSLPPAIYRCKYCNFYIRSDDYRNPTSTIIKHIEKDCQKVERKSGPVSIMFETVSDVDEIRKNVIAGLEGIKKCRLCGRDFRGIGPDLMHHLIEEHRSELYRLV